MADIIQLKAPAPLVLICYKCKNQSFVIFDDEETIECSACGTKQFANMKFVTEVVEKKPEDNDGGTTKISYTNFSVTTFVNNLLEHQKLEKDDLIVVGALFRGGQLQCWRHNDVSSPLGSKVHRKWVKRRLRSLWAMVFAP